MIAFNSRESLPPYNKIDVHPLTYVDEIKYVGVVMQSNLKFNRHIASKQCKESSWMNQTHSK